MNWKIWHSVALFGSVAVIVILGAVLRIPLVTTFYLTLVVMTAMAAAIGHGVIGLWLGILIDENDRLSLSRFQLVLWTIVLLAGILTSAFANLFRVLPVPTACAGKGPLDIAISPNVWALMGITLTSAVAAAMVNQTNRTRNRPIIKNAAPTDASWADLFETTEGSVRRVDMTRVQNFYFTVVLVIAYTALLQQLFAQNQFICSFPELTSGMLTLLGISHAGYLVAKSVPR